MGIGEGSRGTAGGNLGLMFVSDIRLPRMLHAVTIRSPVARGRLVSVAAPRLPPGFSLIRAADVPGENRLEGSAMPILAGGALSYIGEPVALLVGDDREALAQAAWDVKVAAEEDPGEQPVLSTGEAMERLSDEPEIAAATRSIRLGDPEAAFASAHSVVRSDCSTGIQEHGYSEPCCAVAWFEEGEDGGERTLAVATATGWPSHVAGSVALALGMEAAAVSVRPTDPGVHLDGKLWYPSLLSCHAALAALVSGRPVRLAPSAKEDFEFSPKRAASRIALTTGLDTEGRPVAVGIEATVDVGAHGVFAQEMIDQACLGSLGLVSCPNVSVRGIAARTNVPPAGPFAGFALAQGAFAAERHVSLIAGSLGEDPAAWRGRITPGDASLPLGLPFAEPIPAAALIGEAAGMSDYRRKWAAYELLRKARNGAVEGGSRGIGVAVGWQGGSPLHAGVEGEIFVSMTLEKDGSLEIRFGRPEPGAEAHDAGVCGRIAAETLGIDPGAVRAVGEPTGPSVMSRRATVLAGLVERAALAIRDRRFRDPLPITAEAAADPDRDPAWDALFPAPAGRYPDRSGFLRPGSAAAVVEVETAPGEQLPRIRGAWLAVDGGRILDEDAARKALRLSAAQALGWAFRERVAYTAGRLGEGDFADHALPSSADIPPIGIEFVRPGTPDGALPKGIGDLPFACIPAAFMQAVSQATGKHLGSIPLTPGSPDPLGSESRESPAVLSGAAGAQEPA